MTIEALHAAIAAQIASQFPSYRTVEFYRDDEDEKFATPACLLEMTEVEPSGASDNGTGQFPVLLRFEARVILPHRDGNTPMEVRKAASALATFLYLKRWAGVFVDPAQVIACEPDSFTPNQKGFKVWRVEWVHTAWLGDNVWLDPGTDVEVALYSFSPKIGAAHEADYRPIEQIGETLP